MMQYHELDRLLCDEPAILPSSEFTAAVMAALRREASAPAPLPFPWTRALPGLLACAFALAFLFQQVFAQPGVTAVSFRQPRLPMLVELLATAKHLALHGIAFALFLAFASMHLSARLAQRSEAVRNGQMREFEICRSENTDRCCPRRSRGSKGSKISESLPPAIR